MSDPSITLLRDLVAIDSVNPSLVEGAAGEGAIADAIAAHMRRLGLDVEVQEVVPGRPNVMGVLQGAEPGRSLMLCGHMDTVGVTGMEAPFDPVQKDGRIYGRGSQDMKGGLAAYLVAAAAVAEACGDRGGDLLFTSVIEEECGGNGMWSVQRAGYDADATLIGESTAGGLAQGAFRLGHRPSSS